MDAGPYIPLAIGPEQIAKVVHTCAEACGVPHGMVEKVCPASEEQEYRMDQHIRTGSAYMTQIIMHIEGGLKGGFIHRALSSIRHKNHALRTRLIKHNGQIYQVVLRDSIVLEQFGGDLQSFLAHKSQTRMDYGTPLSRYDFILETGGEVFFVWTGEALRIELIPQSNSYSNVL